MSYGFNLGKLNSGSTGLSYVSSFTYTAGTSVTKEFTAEAFAFATGAQAILLPQVGVPASTVPKFPVIKSTLSTTNKKITVTVSGGNVSSTILVFVK